MVPVNRLPGFEILPEGLKINSPAISSIRGNPGHPETLAFGYTANHEVGGARKGGHLTKNQVTMYRPDRERQMSATKEHLPEPHSPAKMSQKSFMRLPLAQNLSVPGYQRNNQLAYHSFLVPHYPTRRPGRQLTHTRGIQTSLSAISWD